MEIARQPVSLVHHRQLLTSGKQHLNLLRHAVEVAGKLPQLIPRRVARRGGEIAATPGLRGAGQRAQAPREAARDDEAEE